MTTPVVARPSPAGRRWVDVVLGVGGQLLNAATNVLTAYVASLLLAPPAFGSFVLAFAVVSLALAAGRGLIGSTLMVQLPSVVDDQDRTALVRSVAGFTLLVALAATVVLALAALVEPVLWVFVAWVAAALVQDVGRYVFLAAGDAARAFVLDAVWALVQATTVLVGALLLPEVGVGLLATAWGLGALGGAVAFLVLHPLRPIGPGGWIRATRDVSGWFTAVAVLGQAEIYGVLLLTGAVLGATEVGGIRAVQLLAYQPALVVLGALLVLLQPVVVRARAVPGELRRTWRSLHLAVAPVVGGLLLLALLREPLMALLFGQYVAYAPLVVPIVIQSVFAALSIVPMAVQRGLRQGAMSFAVQASRAGAVVVAAALGARLGGATGLAWSLALVAAAAWVQVTVSARRAMSREELAPAGATS